MSQGRSLFALSAACAMGAMGALVFLALPLLVGLIISERGYTEQQAGLIASSYFATYFLASASSILWIDRLRPGRCGAVACLCMATGTGLSTLTQSQPGLSACMAVAGVGGGILFSLATSTISRRPQADRDFGWLLATQQLLAAAFLTMSSNWNLLLTLGCIAFLSLLLIPAALALPNNSSASSKVPPNQDMPTHRNQAPLALLALMINFMALSALWAFVERIGFSSGLSSDALSSALSLSMLAGLAGALLVTWLGDRWGQRTPLWLSALAFLSVCGGYSLNMTWPVFLTVTSLLSFSWNFSLAYQMGVIAGRDISGKYSALIPAAQGAGAMLGPALGGAMAVGGNYAPLLSSVALLVIVSITGFSILARRPVNTGTAAG